MPNFFITTGNSPALLRYTTCLKARDRIKVSYSTEVYRFEQVSSKCRLLIAFRSNLTNRCVLREVYTRLASYSWFIYIQFILQERSVFIEVTRKFIVHSALNMIWNIYLGKIDSMCCKCFRHDLWERMRTTCSSRRFIWLGIELLMVISWAEDIHISTFVTTLFLKTHM